jgi:hypothetical protein
MTTCTPFLISQALKITSLFLPLLFTFQKKEFMEKVTVMKTQNKDETEMKKSHL